MDSNSRVHRLLRILSILQSGRPLNSAQLAENCAVSRRTIFRDLRTLQDSGIMLRYDEQRQGYSLISHTYVPPSEFTIEEILSLVNLCTNLAENPGGVPFQEAAVSAAHKLLSTLPVTLRDFIGEVTEGMHIDIGPRNLLTGSDSIYHIMTEAIGKRRQVRIAYQSLMPNEPDEFSTLLSPYRLLFGRSSWYIIGRSSLHRTVRTFNLGRIRQAELVESGYETPSRFSLERYLGNAWFLIRERNARQDVVIRFQPMVARNVADVQWHKTQELVWRDDGTLDFHVTVDGTREILWWILGYGDQAEVIEPKSLRDEVLKRIKNMRELYNVKSSADHKPAKRTRKKK